MTDKDTAEKLTKAMHHLAHALDRSAEVAANPPDSDSEIAGRVVAFVAGHPAYADMVNAHGPRNIFGGPTLGSVLRALVPVFTLAQGVEGSAHNGCTFEARRDAARRLVRDIHSHFPRTRTGGAGSLY